MGQAQTRIGTTSPIYGEGVTSDQIKSDIDHTRHEMDETIDQLTERLRPRHLIDEVICMIQESGTGAGESAKEIGRTVGRQVRDNPVPLALIGAGVAWMLMSRGESSPRRRGASDDEYSSGLTAFDYPAGRGTETPGIYERDETLLYQTDMEMDEPYYHYDPGTAPSGQRGLRSRAKGAAQRARTGAEDTAERVRQRAEEASSRAGRGLRSSTETARQRVRQAGESAAQRASQIRGSAQQTAASTTQSIRQGVSRAGAALSEAAHSASERASHLGETAREQAHHLRETASEQAGRLREEARHGYEYGREAVVEAKEKHPLMLAGGFLALGVLAGLAISRTRRENEMIGPTADRLKERAREAGHHLADRGAEIASATTSAAREEAKAQGLTPEALKEEARHAASDTANAALDAANREGVTPYDLREKAQQVGEDTREGMRESARKEGLTGEQLKERAGKVAERAKDAAKNEATHQKEGAKEDVKREAQSAKQDVKRES